LENLIPALRRATSGWLGCVGDDVSPPHTGNADGWLARLAVLSGNGMCEDPARGTHESFLGEVMDVADEPPMVFDAATELPEVIDYLNAFTPATAQPPPR